jgi:hypothetical protein
MTVPFISFSECSGIIMLELSNSFYVLVMWENVFLFWLCSAGSATH